MNKPDRKSATFPPLAMPFEHCPLRICWSGKSFESVLEGLASGRLYEVLAVGTDDAAAGMAFVAMLANRLGTGRPLLWLQETAARRAMHLHAPGLAELGLDPQNLILAEAPDARELLRGAVDAVRCLALGVVVIEVWRSHAILNLTTTRRLSLAAETSGVTPLLLRIGTAPSLSAARIRWSVRAIPSCPLETGAPGHPTLEIVLLRHRDHPAGTYWHTEWNRDARRFQTFSRTVFSFPADRSAAGEVGRTAA